MLLGAGICRVPTIVFSPGNSHQSQLSRHVYAYCVLQEIPNFPALFVDESIITSSKTCTKKISSPNSRIINLFLGFLVIFDLLNIKNISSSPPFPNKLALRKRYALAVLQYLSFPQLLFIYPNISPNSPPIRQARASNLQLYVPS